MAKSQSKGLAVSSKALDPTLSALFSHSAGPVTVPSKSRYTDLQSGTDGKKHKDSEESAAEDELDELEDGSDGASDELDEQDSVSESDPAEEDSGAGEEAEFAHVLETAVDQDAIGRDGRKRKRKAREDDDDLESRYLAQLQDDDEPTGKRLKDTTGTKVTVRSDSIGTAEKRDDEGTAIGDAEDDDSSSVEDLVHESLQVHSAATELDKANRTAFLSNVSIEAVTSAQAKKTLMAHLSSILDKTTKPPQVIESIRFRSTAFASSALPKRAAYAQKSVMDATTKSTNAYVVYSSSKAVRAAVNRLNGSVVLDRHLRVDSVAHPAPQDHKRCVFVGNLGFVNDETVLNVKTDEDGKETTEKRKRTKQPMDVEEGLWRVFNKEAGKVESVRVVRDAATRVGKGFAYVQFYDANDVESALLLAGKRFPPMLPRDLRVTRCKAPHKTARAMEAKRGKVVDAANGKPRRKSSNNDYAPKTGAKEQSLAGRAGKLLGRVAGSQMTSDGARRRLSKAERKATGAGRTRRTSGEHREKDETSKTGPAKAPEAFVFEGRRASAKDGKPKDLKFKNRKPGAGRKAALKKRIAK